MKGSSESTSQREFLIITSKISKSYYCQVYSSTPWRRECLAELINIGIGSHSSSTSFPPFWFLFQLLHCSFPRLQVVAGDQVGGAVHHPAPCQHHARVWNLNTGRSALNFTTSFSQLANSRGIAKTVFFKGHADHEHFVKNFALFTRFLLLPIKPRKFMLQGCLTVNCVCVCVRALRACVHFVWHLNWAVHSPSWVQIHAIPQFQIWKKLFCRSPWPFKTLCLIKQISETDSLSVLSSFNWEEFGGIGGAWSSHLEVFLSF